MPLYSVSIVQCHTSLSEIKLAAQLLWRVKVSSAQVALGFGFYGQAFTLQDLSFTRPGCPFSGGAKPSPCTGTSRCKYMKGEKASRLKYSVDVVVDLAHYEIQDILAKSTNAKRDIQLIGDKEAAVKYFMWDTSQ